MPTSRKRETKKIRKNSQRGRARQTRALERKLACMSPAGPNQNKKPEWEEVSKRWSK